MKKVRIGIIGVGSMGSHHCTLVKETATTELVAVCDIDRAVADARAKEHGVKAWYDGGKLIASGTVDAVMIATPHYAHTPLAIAALDHGVHVLCEKPIAVHKADAAKMIAAHKRHPKLKFAAMFQMRTNPLYRKVKELLDGGELGKILRVNWIITNWFRSQAYYNSGGWRATWQGEGGGVLLNQCPHNIDMCQWLFGMPERVRAFCHFGKYHDIEVEDDVTAYFEYPGGATGVFITTTGEAPGTNRLEITCDRGRVIVEDGQIRFDRLETPIREFCRTTETKFDVPARWEVRVPVNHQPGSEHQRIIANFADAILNGTPLIAPAPEGINSVELANGMLFSSFLGKTVELPLDAAAYEKQLQKLIRTSTFKKKKPAKAAKAEGMGTSFNKA
jgi:predicted dehydrogenase